MIGEDSNQILPPKMAFPRKCARIRIGFHSLTGCLMRVSGLAAPSSIATPMFSNWVMSGKSVATAMVCFLCLRIPKSLQVVFVLSSERLKRWVVVGETAGAQPKLLMAVVLKPAASLPEEPPCVTQSRFVCPTHSKAQTS